MNIYWMDYGFIWDFLTLLPTQIKAKKSAFLVRPDMAMLEVDGCNNKQDYAVFIVTAVAVDIAEAGTSKL